MITAQGLPVKAILPVVWPRALMLLVISVTCVLLYNKVGNHVSVIDLPLQILGTVLAILLGFRVNSAYGRWWEARIIWGSIVNDSRSIVRLLIGFCKGAPATEVTRLVYRQIAFCYALAGHLRGVPFHETIAPYLDSDELEATSRMTTAPNHILLLQTKHIQTLLERGLISDRQQQLLENQVSALVDGMGKCERIKKTVFPYDYSWYTSRLVDAFGVMIPFVIVDDSGWQAVPWTVFLGFALYSIDRLAHVIENPFEDRANDTAMTAISRTIEIDVKQMLGEQDGLSPIEPVDGVLK